MKRMSIIKTIKYYEEKTMSTTISCRVDTKPMAEELHSVSNHVKGTTAAVPPMQAAVIAAENSGAHKVCSNVN